MKFPKISKWALIYFVLAGVDLLTIAGSLSLSHQGMTEFERSVEANSEWAERLKTLTILNQQAQRVNAPGNDVFDNHDVDGSRRIRDTALVAFQATFSELGREYETISSIADRSVLNGYLAGTDTAMAGMLDDAEHIFSFFAAGDPTSAARLMASMDRGYGEVTNTISGAMMAVQEIQAANLSAQLGKAASLRKFEYLIGFTILLIVTAVAIYGHKMGSMMSKAEDGLRASRDEAQAANRQKSIFLANMSHEIRTPLNGVIGMATAVGQTRLDSEQRNQVNIIRESGELLLETINDILDISKIEAGQVTVETVPFNLRDVLDRIERLHEPVAIEKGLGFEVCLEDRVVEHMDRSGDPTRLTQILHNLVSNAIKFTRSGKVVLDVVVSGDIATDSSTLCISVTDTGQGLTKPQMEQIFKPFTQADETTTRTHGGTGLGLTIVSQMAELMDGKISVDSVVGQGSRFSLTLPLPYASEDSHTQTTDTHTSTCVSLDDLIGEIPANCRILVADDNLTNRLVLKALLAPIKADVVFAKDGLEAVASCAARRFDIVFMDIRMPVCDGEEAMRRIVDAEGINKLVHVPIIAQTANAMVHEVDAYLTAGFDGCLAKPVHQIELFQCIRDSLDIAARIAAASAKIPRLAQRS